MRKLSKLAVVFGVFFANAAFAHNVQLNQSVPNVSVAKDGELTVAGGKVSYKNWSSSSLGGKVRIIHHFAGTGVFVKSSVEDGKLENPHSQVVLDQQGNVKKAWGLKEKESFIAVLDKSGKVQFTAEGKLSAKQITEVIGLVKTLTQ